MTYVPQKAGIKADVITFAEALRIARGAKKTRPSRYEREGRACTGVTNSLELNPGGELNCTWEESSLCFAEIGVGGRSDRIQRQV